MNHCTWEGRYCEKGRNFQTLRRKGTRRFGKGGIPAHEGAGGDKEKMCSDPFRNEKHVAYRGEKVRYGICGTGRGESYGAQGKARGDRTFGKEGKTKSSAKRGRGGKGAFPSIRWLEKGRLLRQRKAGGAL